MAKYNTIITINYYFKSNYQDKLIRSMLKYPIHYYSSRIIKKLFVFIMKELYYLESTLIILYVIQKE